MRTRRCPKRRRKPRSLSTSERSTSSRVVPVRELYRQTLAERGYSADPAQLRAIAALERCEGEWADYKARRSNALAKMLVRPPIPRGVYMYGGVGRGKSFLMECFF